MGQEAKRELSASQLNVSLERDGFCRTIIRELSGLLEEMVGLDEAAGFISVVGQNIGTAINEEYKQQFGVDRLDHDKIEQVLLDLKARINGEFYVEEVSPDRIVFGNTKCPFEEKVEGRPSLCMMTSNVFGTITAENNGYAKVILNETIAQGCERCKVTVYFEDNEQSQSHEGREYFKDQ